MSLESKPFKLSNNLEKVVAFCDNYLMVKDSFHLDNPMIGYMRCRCNVVHVVGVTVSCFQLPFAPTNQIDIDKCCIDHCEKCNHPLNWKQSEIEQISNVKVIHI